jgi:hypothetical protein
MFVRLGGTCLPTSERYFKRTTTVIKADKEHSDDSKDYFILQAPLELKNVRPLSELAILAGRVVGKSVILLEKADHNRTFSIKFSVKDIHGFLKEQELLRIKEELGAFFQHVYGAQVVLELWLSATKHPTLESAVDSFLFVVMLLLYFAIIRTAVVLWNQGQIKDTKHIWLANMLIFCQTLFLLDCYLSLRPPTGLDCCLHSFWTGTCFVSLQGYLFWNTCPKFQNNQDAQHRYMLTVIWFEYKHGANYIQPPRDISSSWFKATLTTLWCLQLVNSVMTVTSLKYVLIIVKRYHYLLPMDYPLQSSFMESTSISLAEKDSTFPKTETTMRSKS